MPIIIWCLWHHVGHQESLGIVRGGIRAIALGVQYDLYHIPTDCKHLVSPVPNQQAMYRQDENHSDDPCVPAMTSLAASLPS